MKSSSDHDLEQLGDSTTEKMIFRLYLAGRAPNSMMALANLKAICKEHFSQGYKIEIVDVLEDPQRAITDHILATPTLVKLSPPPVYQIIGNLNDRLRVLDLLYAGE